MRNHPSDVPQSQPNDALTVHAYRCWQMGRDNAIALANLEPALCSSMWRASNLGQQQQMDQFCEQYQLFAEDWYVGLKQALLRREILLTATAF